MAKRKKSQPAQPTAQESPLHQPVRPEEVSGARRKGAWRTRIDRALPPFTTQRYVVIWLLVMVPLVLVLLLLARPWERGTAAPSATPTAQATPVRATATTAARGTPTAPAAVSSPVALTRLEEPDRYLVIETEKGRIVARLRTDPQAGLPVSVPSFIEKVSSGFFDGQEFYRVEAWMIQGGDSASTSRIPAEYNNIPFGPGTVALAHGVDPANNSDSQIIITRIDAPALNGEYTNIGQVVEGMDVVKSVTVGDKMLKVTVGPRP